MKYTAFDPQAIKKGQPAYIHISKAWNTELYQILYDKVKHFEHLRITRHDHMAIHNYMHLQQIKNDLLGHDVIAIEVYPRQKDFHDGSNTYHIWTWDGIHTPNLRELYQYNQV